MTESLFHLINEKDTYNILACMEYEKLHLISKSKILPFRIDYKKLTELKFPLHDAIDKLLINDPISKCKNPWKIIYITLLTEGIFGSVEMHYKLKAYSGSRWSTHCDADELCLGLGKDLILLLSNGDCGTCDSPAVEPKETYVKLLNKTVKVSTPVIEWEDFHNFDTSIENALLTYSYFHNAKEIAEYLIQRGMFCRDTRSEFDKIFENVLGRNHPKEIDFLRYMLTNHATLMDEDNDYYLLLICAKFSNFEFVKLLLKFEHGVEYYSDFIDAMVDDDGSFGNYVSLSSEIRDIIKESMKRDCNERDFNKLLKFAANVFNR